MAKEKKRTALDDYYAEKFPYRARCKPHGAAKRRLHGGELKTRKEIIFDLKAKGGTEAMIHRYLQGLDLARRLDELTFIPAPIAGIKGEEAAADAG